MPLSMLKQDTIAFSPALSDEKYEGMDGLGEGLVDKMIIEFDSIFWDDADSINFISLQGNEFGVTFNLDRYLNKPILVVLNAGDTAREFSDWTDEELLDETLTFLEKIYGNAVSNVVNYERSNWSKEPNIEMSYSYITTGGNMETDCAAIQANIDKKVFFAGEHTYCSMIGSVEGAYISGYIAAMEISGKMADFGMALQSAVALASFFALFNFF